MGKFKFPTAYTILFVLIALVAAMTWIVPAGKYQMVTNAALGKEVPVAGTYAPVEAQPQGITAVLLAPIDGLYNHQTYTAGAIDVALFVLIIGGFLGVVNKTGAIDAGIERVATRLNGREEWMIPILMALFAAGGTIYGILLRVILLLVGYVICVYWVMRYARKVRNSPESSIVADKMAENQAHFLGNRSEMMLEFTPTRKAILILFAASFAFMIYGVAVLGWWMAEISAVFLAAAVIVGVIARMGEETFTSTFIDGARDLLGVALIIGIARGIVVVMDNGMITHTILHSAENLVSGLSTTVFINVTYWLEVLLSFLVPSSSGLAVLTMPIMAPLADFAHVQRDLVVTAYQSASGVVNLITPTSAVVMGGLAIARVPWVRYLRWVAPLLLILTMLNMIVLSIAAMI